MKDNDHITHGYRINFNTPRKIFRSLFMVHNESVNIWSHFLPAIIILSLLFSFYLVVDQTVVKKSILACQTQIEEGLAHYSHAL
jgi:adiponectin receptor